MYIGPWHIVGAHTPLSTVLRLLSQVWFFNTCCLRGDTVQLKGPPVLGIRKPEMFSALGELLQTFRGFNSPCYNLEKNPFSSCILASNAVWK